MKSKIVFFLKIILSAGIIAYLIVYHGQSFLNTLRNVKVGWFVVGVMLYLIQVVACGLRWRSLSRDMGFFVPARAAISMTFSSLFVSLIIPGGALSSDIVKISMVASYADKGTKTEGVATIIIDRVVGMIAMFILTLLCMPIASKLIMQINWPNNSGPYLNFVIITCLTFGSIIGVVLPLAIIVNKRLYSIPVITKCLNFLQKVSRGLIGRLINSIQLMRDHQKNLWFQIVLCIFSVHLMSCMTAWCMAIAVGVSGECFLPAFIAAIMIGNVAALIPLFPGGIGGRDLVIFGLLSAAGCTQGLTVTLLNTLAIICGNLFGIIFWFCKNEHK